MSELICEQSATIGWRAVYKNIRGFVQTLHVSSRDYLDAH